MFSLQLSELGFYLYMFEYAAGCFRAIQRLRILYTTTLLVSPHASEYLYQRVT